MNVLEKVKKAAKEAESQHYKEAINAEKVKRDQETEARQRGVQAADKKFPKICEELVQAAKSRKNDYHLSIYDNTEDGASSYDSGFEEQIVKLLTAEGFFIKRKSSHYKPTGSDNYYDHDTYSA
jgi:hypothetical protein